MADTPPLSIEALRPADTPEFMTPAWLGCLSFAIQDDGILSAFRADTGIMWKPGQTGFERMIDSATKADEHFIEAFIKWANVNVWGPVNGPEPK